MNCSCCSQTQVENPAPTVSVLEENVEDGDILQEIGNAQYTLEFLRQVIQQSSRVIDEAPPAYEDFDKYPRLSKYQASVKDSNPVKPCTQQPRQFSQFDSDQHVNSSAVSWIEPYPKPQGDPPPAFFNWLRNRFGSLRQSIMSRLSSQSNQLQGSSVFSIHDNSSFAVSSTVNIPEPSNSVFPAQLSGAVEPKLLELNDSKMTRLSSLSSSRSSASSIVCATDEQTMIGVSTISSSSHSNQISNSSCTNVPQRTLIVRNYDIEQNDSHDDTDEINQSTTH
ncbi:ubiquitin-specific peptidase 2 (C19 family) [Schistosoma mansoni]|uniref:Ubiquitin-specific peptidase 2 (C19 family) n=1 Tax=Schistosoma mansoni TaxID=6183 RepID=G4VD01_SCHMA|nr:ubiquitin-specific peptidase 2 (C19 family) [Schistosoma mansoni]|eukprot:XP_018650395.1 ubiquitin-specific peptidase 2 (C19 family) [Schistosoma mansoni]